VSSGSMHPLLRPIASLVYRAVPVILPVLAIFFLANDSSSQSSGLSTICKFTAGPRAGTTQDYAPRDPAPVGSLCYDGQGSTGFVVSGGGQTYDPTDGMSGEMSTLCKFTNGPRAGQTQDYAPMAPLPVGAPCHDDQQSTGFVVSASTPLGGRPNLSPSPSPSPLKSPGGLSTICKFTAGPRAGTTQDYAPRDPAPVGSLCYDGQGSTGFVIR
jgi:hypothetical protein